MANAKVLNQNETTQALAELFGILADQTRLNIVMLLLDRELPVGEIAARVGMSLSAVSHQLRLLKSTKLVKYRKEGKNVFYALSDNHIEQILAVAREHIEE